MHKKFKDRNNKLVELYKSGIVLHDIGVKFGISRERVRQILAKLGVTHYDGGQHIRAKQNAIKREQKYWAGWLPRYQCTRREFRDIEGCIPVKAAVGSLAFKYYSQKRNSAMRGIKFNLTFPEWWKIWVNSGKIGLMGVGIGKYCMSRFNDCGEYRIDNVAIIESAQNNRDASRHKFYRRDFPFNQNMWYLTYLYLSNKITEVYAKS